MLLEQRTIKLTTEVVAPLTFITATRTQEVLILYSLIHDEKPNDAKIALPVSNFNLGKATWRPSHPTSIKCNKHPIIVNGLKMPYEVILVEAGFLHSQIDNLVI